MRCHLYENQIARISFYHGPLTNAIDVGLHISRIKGNNAARQLASRGEAANTGCEENNVFGVN